MKTKTWIQLSLALSLTTLIGTGYNYFSSRIPSSTAIDKRSFAQNRKLLLKKAQKTLKKAGESSVIMNDPAMSQKWGLQKTDTSKAWNVSQGSRDIIVAVIDTGIDVKHPDLRNNLWVNKGEVGKDARGRDKAHNGIDDDGNGFIDDVHGWNFVHANSNLKDNHGHGTHISGIIGAEGGNGVGISGVAPKVSIMTLKYFDPTASGTDYLKNTIRSINYAVKMGAHIINYSGGGLEFSAEERQAVEAARKKGILFVAASGNEFSNSDKSKYYPASYDLSNIISVTAVNPKINVLKSSNYGTKTVDIAAPGENIYSTLPGGYGLLTGTSQATAFVTGVAALVMAHHQDFTAERVKKYILATGDNVPSLIGKTGTSKKLNSYKALVTLDQGVSLTGVIAQNTVNMGNDFSSETTTRGTASSPNAQMSNFGRSLMRAIQSQN